LSEHYHLVIIFKSGEKVTK